MILTKRNLDDFHQWFEGLNSDGGMILMDKALDWTSFDVVAKLRALKKADLLSVIREKVLD
jgi:tRNA U55 pseudouridine synthase TruB